MHDCLQTQDNLIDLLFNELEGATRSRLLAEVAACSRCGAQYRSLNETLDVCAEASAAAMPRESYWPQYHAALNRRLHEAAGEARAEQRSAPFWRRLFTTSIRVPVPLAATAVLLLFAVSVLAFSLVARSASETVFVAAPAASQGEAAPQIKFIEVPVIQEKIVTQTIYVPRRNSGNQSAEATTGARRTPARENLAGDRRQNAPAPEASAPPRANLSGFKPAGEVNLRIIKGSQAVEQ
ncbi:MAG TPA: hypothetical protein VGB76_02575 [Pyrinomonadaceae bacterium]|jgi:hypothetical protein